MKEIQRYCKTKICAQKVPSLNDVANTKIDNVLEEIEKMIEKEDLTMMINAIEEKVNDSDYTAMDMAAAFLKLYTGMKDENESEDEFDFGDTGAEEPGMVRLFINIGKKQKARPGEVPREYARDVLHAMQNVKIKGKSIAIEPANQK